MRRILPKPRWRAPLAVALLLAGAIAVVLARRPERPRAAPVRYLAGAALARVIAGRVHAGMGVDDVEQVVPLADRVEYYRRPDSALVQRFVYARPREEAFGVDVVYADSAVRAAGVAGGAGGLRPVAPEAAYRQLHRGAGAR